MEELGNKNLQNIFDQCDFMTKGAEMCRVRTIYSLKFDKKVFKLCKPCIENCQNNPEYNEDNLIEDMGEDFVCECAQLDHAPQFKKGDKDIEGFEIKNVENQPCQFSETLQKIHSTAFFKYGEETLCLFCYFDLTEQVQSRAKNKLKVSEAIFVENPQAACTCKGNGCDHSLGAAISKFRTCFKYIVSPLEDEKFLSFFIRPSELIFFFYNYPIFVRFFKSYFSEVIHAAEIKVYPIDDIDFENKNEEFVFFKDDEAIWGFIHDFLTINENINLLIYERQEINLKNAEMAKTIDFNKLDKLLDPKVKRNSFTFNAQISGLFIYYNTHIFPRVKESTSIYFTNDLNLSPIHRLMFFKEHKKFMQGVGGQKKFFGLIEKLQYNITQLHEDRNITILSKIKDIKHCVRLMIKYIHIFSYFTITLPTLLDKYADVINETAKIIYFLMNNTHTDPISTEPSPLKTIYLYLRDEKKFDREEIYDKYITTNVIRLRFERLIKNLMIKMNDMNFKKAFIEYDEEALGIPFNFESLNMCFENEQISRKLIGGLLDMGFQKNDGSGDDRSHMGDRANQIYINKIADSEIMQILFHEDDCYVNGLKGICKCYIIEKLAPETMKDIILERDTIDIPNNLNQAFEDFKVITENYFSLTVNKQDYCNFVGKRCKDVILILLPMLNINMDPDTSEIIQTSKTRIENNFAMQFKFAKLGYLENLMRLIDVVTKVKLKNFNAKLAEEGEEEDEYVNVDIDAVLKINDIIEKYSQTQVILLLLKCLEILTYMNPFLSVPIFMEKFLTTLAAEPYLQQKTFFLKRKLNALDVNYYRSNLLNFCNFLLRKKNELIKKSDTTLILSMIKHVLKMNNNKIFSNLSDILKDLIKKLIDHFKSDDNPVIRKFTNPGEEIVVSNPIPRKFGSLYHGDIAPSKTYTNEENLAYEESLFKAFQKILYYINNGNFFRESFLKNENGSLEYFSLFSGKLGPKVTLLLMRNVFHYCFRYPRRFFEYKTDCYEKFLAEPLFWVDDKSMWDKDDDEDEGEEEVKQLKGEGRLEEKDLEVHTKEEKAESVKDEEVKTDITEKYSLNHENKTKISTIMKNIIMVHIQTFNNIVKNNPQAIKNRESFYMRYYYNTVVIPSSIYIYKTILVTKNMSIMQKYEIYEVILNLLNSFSIFLEEICNQEMFDLEKALYINEKRKFVIFEGTTRQEILRQSQMIGDEVIKMEEKNDPKKLRDNMKVLENYFKYFRLLEDKNIIEKKDNILSQFVESYAEKKLKFGKNVLKSLLNMNDIKASSYKENSYYMFMKDVLKERYTQGIPTEPNLKSKEDTPYDKEEKEVKELKPEEADGERKVTEEIILKRKDSRKNTIGKSKKDLQKFSEKLDRPVETQEDEENKKDLNKVDSQSHLRFVLINMTNVILIDPEIFQSWILRDDQVDLCRNIIGGYMVPKIRKFFPTQILQGFFMFEQKTTLAGPYGSLVEIIEFLRVLCEGHNQAFQVFMETIDMEEMGDEAPRTKINNFFFKVLTDIIELLEHYLDRQELIGFMEKEPQVEYFLTLYNKIIGYFIEIIQGSFSYVYLTSFIPIPESEFYAFHERHMLLIDNMPRSLRYAEYISSFLSLVDNILQEKVTTSDEIIKKVITYLNELQVDNAQDEGVKVQEFSKVEAFTHLFIIRSFNYFNLYENAKFCLHKVYSKISNTEMSQILHVPCFILLDMYKNNEDFSKDILFNISTSIFIILKNIAMKSIYDRVKANVFLKNLEENKEEEFLFFSKLVRSVELNYSVPENIENLRTLRDKIRNQDPEEEPFFIQIEKYKRPTSNFYGIEIFLIDRRSLKLEDTDIKIIVESCDVRNLYEKQTNLLEYIEVVLDVVNMRKEIEDWSPFLKFVAIMNYEQDKLVTVIGNWVSVCFMLFVNAVLLGTLKLEDYRTGGSMKNLVITVNAIHLAINFFLISNWIFIDGFYNIRMDKKEAMASKFPIFFNCFVGLISTCHPGLYFLFSLGLFSMVPLISVMRIVVVALFNRTEQFAAAGIFLLIFVLIFGGIGFFFMRPNMIQDGTEFCSDYFSCFMNLFNFGLRDMSVIDEPYILPYSDKWYWGRFCFDWSFFFFNIFILINIFNGIVVDTFQSYREEDDEIKDHLENVCYICHLSRNDFEIKSKDFDYHVKNEHSVRDYIDFLVKINFIDENDLNNLGTQTLGLLREKETSMFPMRTALSLPNSE